MKKLMLTTAIASLLVTSAIAQTTITGELRINYKAADAKKTPGGTSAYAYTAPAGLGIITNTPTLTAPTTAVVSSSVGATTAETFGAFGSEQQINVQHKGKLNVGGLDYAAGFSIENDGEQITTLFNENVYIDITNPGTKTTVSLGRDHIQRSDSDRSAAVLVGFSPNDLSQLTFANTTLFQQNLGPAISQNMGAAILQSTDFGTFSYNFVPSVSLAVSEDVQNQTNSGYEYGFTGGLGVKGLNAYYFKSAENDTVGLKVTKGEAKSFGASYNMGQISVGYADKKYNSAAAAADVLEVKEKHYGVSYAINNNATVGVLYAKADQGGAGKNGAQTTTQKVKAVQLGYALGPVDVTASYAKNTDVLGVEGNDSDVSMIRFIGKF